MENPNPKPKNTTCNFTDIPTKKPSFVSVVHGSTKSSANTSHSVKSHNVSLIDQDLIRIDDATRVLLVKLKGIESMSNVKDENELEKVADTFDANLADGIEDIIKDLEVDKDEEVILDKSPEDVNGDLEVPLNFNNNANPTDGRKLLLHEKLKALKPKIKHWVATIKSNEDSHKQVLLKDLNVLDDKIDAGLPSSDDREMLLAFKYVDLYGITLDYYLLDTQGLETSI
nr:RNA-directed DNA polymerase, eukaryota, reverse transcriptase zinc-binding domain protein [Tanacetum cinerariifolium]